MKTMLAVADEWFAAERKRLAASGETVHTGHPAHIVEWLLEEVRRRTLTDAEREAVREACDEGRWYPKDYHHIAALRGLLERTR
jgi:hypothetical protein